MDAARRADLGFTAAVIATAGVFLHQAWRLPSSRFDPLGPGAFPIAICILLLVLSAFGFLSVLRGRSLGRAETSLIVGLDAEASHRRRPALAAFVFVATIAYALVLQFAPVDFSVATAFYVAVTGVAMSRRTRRHGLIAVAVGVGAGLGLTLVFGGMLGLVLP